jgi:hypothetical protein
MIIKYQQRTASHLTPLDLLGNDEAGLSKAFAFVLAKDKDALFTFLRFLGIRTKNTDKNFLATSVEIEHFRPEARTDIEIIHPDFFHVIVECKINKGRILHQHTQYLGAFKEVPNRVMCFITQERDTNKQKHQGIITRHVSWMDIIDVLEGMRLTTNQLVRQFMMYAMRSYKMKTQKEILVQDLSIPLELNRYLKHSVYKRDVTFGSPLYFAPYFTRNVDETIGKGIRYLSRVLGVLTLKPLELNEYRNDLESFSEKPEQVKKWIEGVKHRNKKYQKTEHTFYFLDDPVELPASLLKDGTIKKGRGKNWIAGKIPKNRCITFAEFVRRMSKIKTS